MYCLSMENNDIYVSRVHPEDAKRLEQLTQPKSWDFQQFRKILIAIGMVGGGAAIPAPNRPDTIHLQGFRQYIDNLLTRTKTNGREHAQVVFVDAGRQSLIMSGKITIGSSIETRLDTTKEPGREKYQRRIGSLHTHPVNGISITTHGLSGQDYRTFLGDPEQQMMIVACGESTLMMVLKTSTTPNNLSRNAIDKRIKSCEQDYLESSGKHPLQKVVDFNKGVCMELGLTMYLANQRNRDLFTRVEVTK